MKTTERDDVRRTKWFGGDASIDATQSAHDQGVAELSSSHAVPDSTLLQKRKPKASSVATKIILQDPWELYEARARIFRNVILARHRKRKLELVNVQRLTTEPVVAQSLVETIGRCSHHSFPCLHDFLQHENRYFLVWEPAEFTLNEVLASTCYITEAELAQIVWPILKGIRFLRNEGRTLATLTTRDILFTEAGGVKIAGIEKSQRIETSRISATTLKLIALASIVEKLMGKNKPDHPWSSDAHSFFARLAENYSEGFLDDLLLHPFFAQVEGKGGLKILVKMVNKTAYHEVRPLSRH